MLTFDVLVVGSGASGMRAALAVAQQAIFTPYLLFSR